MAQFGWTYLGRNGRQFKVGLYHGNRSGNLLIHCNARVMIIDFQVKDSKSYTFFLDEELCRIKLERKGDRMFYHFEIDKETDTPRNRARKKQDRRHLIQTLLFFGAILALAFMTYFIMRSFKPKGEFDYPSVEIKQEGNYEQGIAVISEVLDDRLVYSFQKDRIQLKGGMLLDDKNNWGGLLKTGDSFYVLWEVAPPYNSALQIDQPTPRQIDRFIERILEWEEILDPAADREKMKCFLKELVQKRGPSVLPYLYNRLVPVRENPVYNQESFNQRKDSILLSARPGCRPDY